MENKKTILIIDDEDAIRNSLSDFLEDLEYNTLTAVNGENGLELFKEHIPDLVMVDLRMPKMGGLEFMNNSLAINPRIPTIVISGGNSIDDVVEALRVGAWDYLVKPIFDMTIVAHTVKKTLEKSKLLQENLDYQKQLEKLVKERTKALAKANSDLENTNSQLTVSQTRFKNLADMLPEAVFETDEFMVFTYVNDRAYKMFGYTADDIKIGLNALDMVVEREKEKATENYNKRREGIEAGSIEYTGKRKDGTEFPMSLNITHIKKDGVITGFRGVVLDISARIKTEKEKNDVEDKYRQAQKVEAIGRLAGGVAHDLNNILSPILMYGEMLMDDFGPNDERKQFVSEIVDAGFRARDLVRQLLAFGRKQTLEYKPLNLNDVLDGFSKLIKRTIREDITLDIFKAEEMKTIKADIGQLEQVLMNLCVNSQDAMREGGKMIVETALADINDDFVKHHPGSKAGIYAQLIVSDTGCGMDKETMDQIFEPFFSTKGEQGTGLGLATVYGIVKQHGGHIWVTSEQGKGTTFDVYFPVTDEPATENTNNKVLNTQKIGGSENILLVEDDKHVRNLARTVLLRYGYTVIDASSGHDALTLLNSTDLKVDLLLTDVILPELNGKQLYLEAVKIHKDLKVLYMSGYTDDIIANKGVLNEGVDFIQKPFSITALVKKVRTIIDSK